MTDIYKTNKNLFIDMFKAMVRIRLFEEETIRLFQNGKIIGYLHPGIGHEAADVGSCFALEEGDIVFPTHRGHGVFLARGASMKRVMAELFARETGYNSGHGGSIHLAAPDLGIMQINGILGGQFPLAVGAAFASKYNKNNKVVLCFFGDGAANNGTFHESLNMASIWKLPVVFCCVNNQYAVSTSFEYSASVKDIATRSKSYSIPGHVVDGVHIEKVYDLLKKAVNRARKGSGPSLIEIKTYRRKGHHLNDSASYRSKEELIDAEKKCAIEKTRKKIISSNILNDNKIRKIYEEIKEEINEAVEFAEESPLPSVEDYKRKIRS